ncbi:hypothetical protein XELAEV_18013161mg [Xenopus laevis]|uniref:Uncharacterized protein n=1 Tax=Xenopus laevis TaxID=8355 RepID=A0A974HYT6_XENLA|nr:hypothetical protein XELAEV_18013161mg [Xenopus laevis]
MGAVIRVYSRFYSPMAKRRNSTQICTWCKYHLKTLKADFINRGYNPMILDQYIHAATRIPRSQLLQYKQKPEINRVPLVVKYNPQLRTFRKIQTDKIPIPDTLEEYSIHGHYNCSSSNVVYLIQSTKCITGGLYIEETGQSLRKINTHH